MIESAKWVREVIGNNMTCALVTKTCTNLTTNHMETQNNCDSNTCVHSPPFSMVPCEILFSSNLAVARENNVLLFSLGCCENISILSWSSVIIKLSYLHLFCFNGSKYNCRLILLPPSEKGKIQETSAKNQRRRHSLAFYFADVISFVLDDFLDLLYVLFQFFRLFL